MKAASIAPILIIPLLAFTADRYTPVNDFSVHVTILSDLDCIAWAYRLDRESITVTRYAGCVPERAVVRRALSDNEVKSLDRFFGKFPLSQIRKEYDGDRLRGDTCYRYHMRINRDVRDSYVFIARPADLARLNWKLNRLLPKQYRLWEE
jgi:hypothetical protein